MVYVYLKQRKGRINLIYFIVEEKGEVLQLDIGQY